MQKSLARLPRSLVPSQAQFQMTPWSHLSSIGPAWATRFNSLAQTALRCSLHPNETIRIFFIGRIWSHLKTQLSRFRMAPCSLNVGRWVLSVGCSACVHFQLSTRSSGRLLRLGSNAGEFQDCRAVVPTAISGKNSCQFVKFVSHLLPDFLSSKLSPLRLCDSAVFRSDISVYPRPSAVNFRYSALRTPHSPRSHLSRTASVGRESSRAEWPISNF